MMLRLSKIHWLWVWFGLGIAVFVLGVATGGGIAGLLLYWQLESFGMVFPITHVLLAIPLIFVPIVMICMSREANTWWIRPRKPFDAEARGKHWGRRFLIGALIAAVIGGLCYWRTALLPSPARQNRRGLCWTRLGPGRWPSRGPCWWERPDRPISSGYKEALTGRFGTGTEFSHNFVPVTESDWTLDRPVHFLVDTGGEPLSTARPYLSDAGILLRGELPVFVRAALKKKGLQVADDALVLSSDPDFGRIPWLVSAAFCAIGTFVGLLFGLVLPWARSKKQEQLEALRPCVVRYFVYAIGGALMLVGLSLSITKTIHIAKATSTTGVITDTQESGNILSKYSFYVEYNTPQGRYRRFADTWTPFGKRVGDKVRVLYSPSAAGSPQILAFDTEWIVYVTLFFLPGLAIAVPGEDLDSSRARRAEHAGEVKTETLMLGRQNSSFKALAKVLSVPPRLSSLPLQMRSNTP